MSLQPNSRRIHVLIESLASYIERYGYERVDTPLVEPAELFLTRAGDQIINRLFTFEHHGRQLALRPEFTASAAQAYVGTEQRQVMRWQFGGAVFVDEFHQSHSVGAELIGWGSPDADAEIIALAAGGLLHIGIEDWQLMIGQVQLLRAVLARFGLDSHTQRYLLNHLHWLVLPGGKSELLAGLEHLLPTDTSSVKSPAQTTESAQLNTEEILNILLDATEVGGTLGGRTRQDIARRLLHKRQRAAERAQIIAAVDFLADWSASRHTVAEARSELLALAQRYHILDDNIETIVNTWMNMLLLLADYGIPSERILIQPALSRNWDYYTGVVFELRASNGVLYAGGGRYDELTRLLGGTVDVPAVGLAYYLDQFPPSSALTQSRVWVLASELAHPAAVRVAQALRGWGLKVALTSNPAEADIQVHSDSSTTWHDQQFASADDLAAALKEAQ